MPVNLLLNVYGGGDMNECPCALVQLTPEDANNLLGFMRQVDGLKKTDPQLYCIERWSGQVRWFDRGVFDDNDADDLWVTVDEEGAAKISEERAAEMILVIDAGLSRDGAGAAIRTECDVLVTDVADCHWRSIVKHTDIRLETDLLTRDYLAEFMKE